MGESIYLTRESRKAIMNKLNLILKNLLDTTVKCGTQSEIHEHVIVCLSVQVADLLLEEASCLQLDLKQPLCIVGDLFGQYADLLSIFAKMGYPPRQRYLFLGNYVDGGKQSIETIMLLFVLKLKYPKHIYMLRGNHECEYISCHYGFLKECVRRYTKQTWRCIMNTFDCLPAAAVVGDVIFCVHSGLIPCIDSVPGQNLIELNDYITSIIHRPVSLTENFLLTHFTWSEPVVDLRTRCNNPAGLGQWFGEHEVETFCERFNVELVIRGHEYSNDGYEFTAKNKLLSIFSASSLGGMYPNYGAIVYLKNKGDGSQSILGQLKLIRDEKSIVNVFNCSKPYVVEDSIAKLNRERLNESMIVVKKMHEDIASSRRLTFFRI